MSLFDMAVGTRYGRVSFDAHELRVIRIACESVSTREHDLMDDAAGTSIEQYAQQVKKANESEMTVKLVTLFKPDEEILIEREDMEPVLESLKTYQRSVPEEHAHALQSALEKMERFFR
jgi:hypothetical protein